MNKLSKKLICSFVFLTSCFLSGVGLADSRIDADDKYHIDGRDDHDDNDHDDNSQDDNSQDDNGNETEEEKNHRETVAQTEFIQRFYSNLLHRDVDSEGLTHWLNEIKTTSGAQVSLGFFNSQEFHDLELDDSEFIDTLYSTLFGRVADDEGRNYWVAQLESGSLRELIINGFVESPEFDDLTKSFNVTAVRIEDKKSFQIKSFVQRFYQVVLNREPDSDGFNDWASQLSAGTKVGGEIAEGFFNSTEFEGRETEDDEFLEIAYKAFFDRDADEGGKNEWLNQLSAGATRLEIINGFIGSQEFKSLATSFGIEASRTTDDD